MHRQPEYHRDPRESIFKWNLKEVVWGEKKSKEASMAEQNAERERKGHERTGDRNWRQGRDNPQHQKGPQLLIWKGKEDTADYSAF